MKWAEFLEVLARLAHAKFGTLKTANVKRTRKRNGKKKCLTLDMMFVELCLLFRILLPEVEYPPKAKQVSIDVFIHAILLTFT